MARVRRSTSPLLFVLLAIACTGGANTPGPGIARVSTPLPKLEGSTLQGTNVEASSYAGKVLVVNFWATWCGPCRDEQPALQQAYERYAERGVAFVGVDYRDDDAQANEWVRQFGVTYPSIVDHAGAFADDFAFPGPPDTYVVDRTGTIRFWIFGATDAQVLSRLIDSVLTQP